MTSTRTPAPPPPATALGLAGVLGLPLVLVALAVLASAGASPETGGNALPAGAAHRAWVVSVVVALGATAVWWNDRSHPWRWKTHAGVSTAVVSTSTASFEHQYPDQTGGNSANALPCRPSIKSVVKSRSGYPKSRPDRVTNHFSNQF